MIVRFMPEADEDLTKIGDWIAADNPSRAESFVLELRDRCLDLRDFPEAFPIVDELRAEQIRRRNYRRYAILYVADENAIAILRIVHGARELDYLFGA